MVMAVHSYGPAIQERLQRCYDRYVACEGVLRSHALMGGTGRSQADLANRQVVEDTCGEGHNYMGPQPGRAITMRGHAYIGP